MKTTSRTFTVVAIALGLGFGFLSPSMAETSTQIPGIGVIVKHGMAKPAPVIDINTASSAELDAQPGLRQAKDLIILLRSQRPFANAQDFAERVCGRASVDSGFEASIKIGSQQFSPRGGNPKEAGWRCAQGGKTYHTEGTAHNYVGHVTLLR